MLDLNWSDAVSALQSLQNYLIAIGVILVLAVIATVACLKLAKHQKFMIRSQVWIAALIAIVVVVNIICTGPMLTLLTLISGTGTLTQETSNAAVLRVEEIADEGIVLHENQENLLPLAPDSNVNVRLGLHQPGLRRHRLRRAERRLSHRHPAGGPAKRRL